MEARFSTDAYFCRSLAASAGWLNRNMFVLPSRTTAPEEIDRSKLGLDSYPYPNSHLLSIQLFMLGTNHTERHIECHYKSFDLTQQEIEFTENFDSNVQIKIVNTFYI